MCILQTKTVECFCCCVPLRLGALMIGAFECFYNYCQVVRLSQADTYDSTEAIQLIIAILYGTFAALYIYAICVNNIGIMEAYVCAYLIYIPLMLFMDISMGFMFDRYGDFIGELLFKDGGLSKECYPLIIIAAYALRFYFFLVINSLLMDAKMECN